MKDDRLARANALAFLKRHRTGVLATTGSDNVPHASTVHYFADDDFNIYFLTLINSRKFKALSAHPRVALVVSTEEVPQTLQLEGMASDVSLDEKVAKKKNKLFEILNSNPLFYGPITKLDPADRAIVWIRPAWIRWADYAFAPSGTDHVFTEITPTQQSSGNRE